MIMAKADGIPKAPPLLFASAETRRELTLQAETYVARALVSLNRAKALVVADRSDCIELLAARRVTFAAHLQNYQRFKHSNIFDPVMLFGLSSSKVVARSMKVECLALGEEFTAYHTRWLGLHASEWQRYCRDMLATADNLSVHLDAELRAMRQLIMISDFQQR